MRRSQLTSCTTTRTPRCRPTPPATHPRRDQSAHETYPEPPPVRSRPDTSAPPPSTGGGRPQDAPRSRRCPCVMNSLLKTVGVTVAEERIGPDGLVISVA